MDTEKQRQCRHDDARLTESRNAGSEQLRTRDAYHVTNQQRMATMRARVNQNAEGQAVFFFLNISDLLC